MPLRTFWILKSSWVAKGLVHGLRAFGHVLMPRWFSEDHKARNPQIIVKIIEKSDSANWHPAEEVVHPNHVLSLGIFVQCPSCEHDLTHGEEDLAFRLSLHKHEEYLRCPRCGESF